MHEGFRTPSSVQNPGCRSSSYLNLTREEYNAVGSTEMSNVSHSRTDQGASAGMLWVSFFRMKEGKGFLFGFYIYM